MARWNTKKFQEKLDAAVNGYDHSRASECCDELIEHLRSALEPYPESAAKDVLQSLRNKRYFDLMSRAADAFMRAGLNIPQVRRQYAQSLLDQGMVSGAVAVLEDIVAVPTISKREQAEARGLIGRAHKQIYTDAHDNRPRHNQEALLKAADAYYDVYVEDEEKYLWHGVNAAALLARAYRDGVDTGDRPAHKEIGRKIVAVIEEKDRNGEASMWDFATIAEAHVALGDWQDAAKYLERYVNEKRADAFELASTSRQFEDVWQLDRDEGEERYLLDLLRGELLQRTGGTFRASAEQVAALSVEAAERSQGLEKLLGEAGPQSHQWFLLAMSRARAVGRVWHGGRGVGTGFVVPGDRLKDDWADKEVFVTNNHVISQPKQHPLALEPEQARITFDVLHGGSLDQPRYKVKEVLWQSPVPDLDATCTLLDQALDKPFEGFTIAPELPSRKEKDRMYIIGHPGGGDLSYSFQDNTLIDINDKRIHYRSPTEPGNSGSPIFNEEWELVGIHHAGSSNMTTLADPSKTYAANEGIPIKAIREAIATG